jgi:predicted nucleotidyltransferase
MIHPDRILMKRVQNKREVQERLQGLAIEFASLGVERIGLFGSFVRDTPHNDSDVDLLVEFRAEQKNFDNFIRLTQLLETALQRHVELVTPEALSPYLGPHIMKELEYVSLFD